MPSVERDISDRVSKLTLDSRFGHATNDASLAIESLPAPVFENLVKVVKLQNEHLKLAQQYESEVSKIKSSYIDRFKALYDERRKILQNAPEGSEPTGTPGIPGFWLRVMQNNRTLVEAIQPHDEKLLINLKNISYEWLDKEKMLDFRLTFEFSPNDIIAETVLTKTYYMTCQQPPPVFRDLRNESTIVMEPLENALVKIESTPITWKGQDLTKKTVTRKQKNRRTQELRTVTRVEDNPSFFNFFKSYVVPSEAQLHEMDDDEIDQLDENLESDYDLGVTFRECIIPEASRWYMGPIDEDEDDDATCSYADDDLDEDVSELEI